jgi:putative oxidoreductase
MIKKYARHPKLLLLVRLIIGGVFIWAGLQKAQNPQSFADGIANYQLIPISWINPLALGLPVFEILIGTLLIFCKSSGVPSLAVMIVATIFIIALGQAMFRGLIVDCGCFGVDARPSQLKMWMILLRDLSILLGSFLVYREAGPNYS